MSARASAAKAAPVRELTLTRVFDAPRSLVFQVWTQREHLVRWHCPHDFTVRSFDADVRPGGAYRVGMLAPDGHEHWISGTYREVVPVERLVFTWIYEGEDPRNETLVTVVLAEEPGGKTKLTLRQTGFASDDGRDEVHGGWSECLENLAGYLATGQA